MMGRVKLAFGLAVALALLSGSADAQDKTGCDAFKWSVARERGWFADVKPGGFAAILAVANIDKAGSYEITLSDEGRIDAVQGGALVKSSDFSGQKDCPGVRKSVRFDLKSGPLTIQLSNGPSAAINLALAPAQ